MSGILKGIGKTFKKVAKVAKKFAVPLLAVAAIALTAGMALPVIGSLATMTGSMGPILGGILGGAVKGLATGAVLGAIKGGVSGGGILKGATKGGIMGALTGGAVGGISGAVGGGSLAGGASKVAEAAQGGSDIALTGAGTPSAFAPSATGFQPINNVANLTGGGLMGGGGVGSIGSVGSGVGSLGSNVASVGSNIGNASLDLTSLVGSTPNISPADVAYSPVKDVATSAVKSAGGGLLGQGGLMGTGLTTGEGLQLGGSLVSGWGAGKAKGKELEQAAALDRGEYDRTAYNYGYENFYNADKKGKIAPGQLPAEQRQIYAMNSAIPNRVKPFEFADPNVQSQWTEQPYYQIKNGQVVLVRPGAAA